MLESARCGFHKKRIRTRYAELVFFHLVLMETHEGFNPDLSVETEDN
jgi:hypothetical protein